MEKQKRKIQNGKTEEKISKQKKKEKSLKFIEKKTKNYKNSQNELLGKVGASK